MTRKRTYRAIVYTSVGGRIRADITTGSVRRFLRRAGRRIVRGKPIMFDTLILTPEIGVREISIESVYKNPPAMEEIDD